MKITTIIIAAILIWGIAPGASKSNLTLGVLEDVPVGNEEAKGRFVRVIFRKAGSDWVPYKNDCRDQTCLKTAVLEYPQEMRWTIAFDGKNLGHITSHAPNDFETYWRVGQQEITSKELVPTVGERSEEFGGFLDAKVYRPLVAVSEPNFNDPEGWKPGHLSPEIVAKLQHSFHKQFPKLCTSPKDSSTLVAYRYKDTDIKLLKSYAAKTAWFLARLHLQAIDCNDKEAGFDIDDPWFAVDPKGAVRYLGSGMRLVDAGDYDNDGKSELLFSISQYNRGGYRIFYKEFAKQAEFVFSYH